VLATHSVVIAQSVAFPCPTFRAHRRLTKKSDIVTFFKVTFPRFLQRYCDICIISPQSKEAAYKRLVLPTNCSIAFLLKQVRSKLGQIRSVLRGKLISNVGDISGTNLYRRRTDCEGRTWAIRGDTEMANSVG